MHRRMRITALLAAVLLLGTVPAAAETSACDDSGRELVGPDGVELVFDAPGATAPELSAPAPLNHPWATAMRSAVFSFNTDLAPYASGRMSVTLEWAEASDFDIFLFAPDGTEIGRAAADNLSSGMMIEQAMLSNVADCTSFDVHVRAWAGAPTEELTLTIGFDRLVGADSERLSRQDDRRFLYLGGDLGQASMAHGQPNNLPVPLTSALTDERPTGGRPNHYTRPAVGFNDHRNALQAHFTRAFDAPVQVTGDVVAQIWVSSQTMGLDGQEGELNVWLYAGGAPVGGSPVKISGSSLTSHPSRLWVVFPDVNKSVRELTVQVSAEPVRSTQGHEEPAGNAEFTVWYDSVQFPSRIVLPG